MKEGQEQFSGAKIITADCDLFTRWRRHGTEGLVSTLDLTPSGITSNHPAAQEQPPPPRSTAVHPDRAGLSVKADDSWVGVSCTS